MTGNGSRARDTGSTATAASVPSSAMSKGAAVCAQTKRAGTAPAHSRRQNNAATFRRNIQRDLQNRFKIWGVTVFGFGA